MATSPDDRSIDPADPEAIDAVARATGLPTPGVLAVIRLLADGATVPFIARYRKEATGSLDEVQVAAIRDASEADTALRKRRAAILASLVERDLLTDALRREIFAAPDLATLEDLYRPHRPKRRTRATIARERGLEPLAESLFAQDPALSPEKAARPFIDPAKEVPDLESALAGARDIIAERIADDPAVRAALKERLRRVGVIASRVARGKKKEAETPEGAKYRDKSHGTTLGLEYRACECLAGNLRLSHCFRREHSFPPIPAGSRRSNSGPFPREFPAGRVD